MALRIEQPGEMGGQEVASELFEVQHPQEAEGVFNLSELHQQRAYAELPDYYVHVLRRSSHKPKEETHFGTFYQETVRYSDGAVRLVTIGEPSKYFAGEENLSPYPIVSGDPYMTGPDGFNEEKVKDMVKLGYTVIWPHHQGRHSVWPTSRERLNTMWRFISNKGVGRSAHQDHALLDDMAEKADFDTDEVLVEGYSRSSMKGKAFMAIAPQYDRTIHYADLDAPCFAHEATPLELLETAFRQMPNEMRGIAQVAIKASLMGAATGNKQKVRDYIGTFDIHPLNMIHEMAWMRPLINGDAGMYAKAMPLGAVGVTTLFSQDYMSQHADWKQIHAARPNMRILHREGPHLAGAYPENLDLKYQRFARLHQFWLANGMSMTGLTIEDVVPSEDYGIAA